jgi:hypothetical protein
MGCGMSSKLVDISLFYESFMHRSSPSSFFPSLVLFNINFLFVLCKNCTCTLVVGADASDWRGGLERILDHHPGLYIILALVDAFRFEAGLFFI